VKVAIEAAIAPRATRVARSARKDRIGLWQVARREAKTTSNVAIEQAPPIGGARDDAAPSWSRREVAIARCSGIIARHQVCPPVARLPGSRGQSRRRTRRRPRPLRTSADEPPQARPSSILTY
jgi:hypothetical protein